MAIERNKTIFHKEITNYDPDAYASLQLKIAGISRDTEEEIRKGFLEFWECAKAKIQDEISCGTSGAK